METPTNTTNPILDHAVALKNNPFERVSSYHLLDPEVRRFQFKIGGKKATTLKMQSNLDFSIKAKRSFEFVNRMIKKNRSS